jgi:DNA (cytosine-5)-methyltransferase 1
MLPTPIVSDWNSPASEWRETSEYMQLRDIGALLPTPTSQAAKHGELSPVERHGNRPQDNGNLWVVMPRLAEEALLPTPAVNDMGEGKTLEWWDDWAPRQKSSAPPSPDGSKSSGDPHPHLLSLDELATPA